jgi:hypothetical protein
MAATRRSLLTGWLGSLGLAILGTGLARRTTSTTGIVVTRDGWVLRQSDLDLLR